MATGNILELSRNLELLKRRVVELEAVLKAVEWVYDGDGFFCPSCIATQEDGHEADCPREALKPWWSEDAE